MTSLFHRMRSTCGPLQHSLNLRAFRARFISSRPYGLRVSEEVIDAVRTNRPVVALETTIYTHGFPYPENIALSSLLESLVRRNGGIPATIGVLNGIARIGMQPEEIIELLEKAGNSNTVKVSRRDLAFVCSNRNFNGGTTIAGTLALAHLAGIKVFATGGLGGVHRDLPGETSMDISADLTELGRTPIALISSGCKSFLDIPRTLEYLETQGVAVGTFADGRTGPIRFPAFWTRDSDYPSPNVIETEREAAAILHSQLQLPLDSGLLFANPIPLEHSLPKDSIDKITVQAIAEASKNGVTGKANTPYILKRIRELTNGGTVNANRALIEANVIRGTKVAVELAKLQSATLTNESNTRTSTFNRKDKIGSVSNFDVIVAGSIALDLSCDYSPLGPNINNSRSPTLRTSNPAAIRDSVGGVGHNVATAAHFAGAHTLLCSVIGDDSVGKRVLKELQTKGMHTDGIAVDVSGSRTAQYIAMNDEKGNLIIAMADMGILDSTEIDLYASWKDVVGFHRPKWLILDANWSSKTLRSWISLGRRIGAKIAYEPVSVEKSIRVIESLNDRTSIEKPPQTYHAGPSAHTSTCWLDLATPNEMELLAISDAYAAGGYKPGLSKCSASPTVEMQVEKHLQNHLIPVSNKIATAAVKMLGVFSCVLTKLGAKGVLHAEQLHEGDQRLSDMDAKNHVMYLQHSQNKSYDHDISPIGKATSDWADEPCSTPVYLRHYPAANVGPQDIISVNGVGDTFLGVLVAIMCRDSNSRLEDAITNAQWAASETLKSKESVSQRIKHLF